MPMTMNLLLVLHLASCGEMLVLPVACCSLIYQPCRYAMPSFLIACLSVQTKLSTMLAPTLMPKEVTYRMILYPSLPHLTCDTWHFGGTGHS